MTDEHDDGDRTSPDLGDEEHTNPIGPLASVAGSLGAVVADVRTLAATCPDPEEPGRRRHLEILAIALGAVGDLAHDTRRAINAIIREEFP